MNRQKHTECFAAAIAATIVSISVRCPAGSGENASRTCALPIVIGADQPGDSFAVSAIDGFPASACARSLYSAASAGESNACSTFACSVSPSVVKFAEPVSTRAGTALDDASVTMNLSCMMCVLSRGASVARPCSASTAGWFGDGSGGLPLRAVVCAS